VSLTWALGAITRPKECAYCGLDGHEIANNTPLCGKEWEHFWAFGPYRAEWTRREGYGIGP